MNYREIEALLGWIKEIAVFPIEQASSTNEMITEAIHHLRNRRIAAAKRKAELRGRHRLRADETRELLR